MKEQIVYVKIKVLISQFLTKFSVKFLWMFCFYAQRNMDYKLDFHGERRARA